MTAKTHTFPLRLPQSLREAAERIAREDGTSINQLVVTALAEKISAMKTAEFFSERKNRADFDAFDRIMNRKGGQKPVPDDAL
ncbi:MAG: toxin-antitoxin system HicB family antitoxin [Pseudaminobacter sp.]|nr:toxin-antitoxin system HicB family antitoxin [Pseudaminobacter sp.]